jgi:hypothetical protein
MMQSIAPVLGKGLPRKRVSATAAQNGLNDEPAGCGQRRREKQNERSIRKRAVDRYGLILSTD